MEKCHTKEYIIIIIIIYEPRRCRVPNVCWLVHVKKQNQNKTKKKQNKKTDTICWSFQARSVCCKAIHQQVFVSDLHTAQTAQ